MKLLENRLQIVNLLATAHPAGFGLRQRHRMSFPTISLLILVWLTTLIVIEPSAAMPLKQNKVPDARRDRPEKFNHPGLIEFHGEINYKLTQFFKNRFERARREGVDLLIVEIDSPGGLKIESLEMARMLRDCKWAYTVALITDEAISGGALVSLGCDEIYIDPNAKFGDIGEIGFDPDTFAWRLIEPKIESYLSRDARDLAESKGRAPDLAEAMVDKDLEVYIKIDPANPDAAAKFKSVRVDAPNKPQDPWKLIPETGPERFLTVSGTRAEELGIAQHFAVNRDDVAKEMNFSVDSISIYRRTTTDTVIYVLNNPFITGLLVVIGLIALYLEFSAPGIGVGGLVAGLSATLFFWSRFLGGTAGWLEVILFAAGLIFLLMEIFVIPGFGVAGLSGLALLFTSVVLASQDFAVPQTANQWNQTMTTTLMIMVSGVLFIVVAAFITKRLDRIPVFSKLVLDVRSDDSSDSDEKDGLGKPIMPEHPTVSVGDWGVSESFLRPAGRAKFSGRSFDVISDGSFVDPDAQVKVIRIQGNVITVATVDDA